MVRQPADCRLEANGRAAPDAGRGALRVTVALAAPAATGGQSGFEQWQFMLVDWVRSERPDLNNRQLAVLLVVAGDPAPHTVRGLANYLNITKPVISRVLNRLGKLQYLRRIPDKADRRNIFVIPTRLGEAFVKELAADFEEC